jgi:hypothetical protein
MGARRCWSRLQPKNIVPCSVAVPKGGIAAEDVLFHPVLLDHRAGHMGVGTAYLLG